MSRIIIELPDGSFVSINPDSLNPIMGTPTGDRLYKHPPYYLKYEAASGCIYVLQGRSEAIRWCLKSGFSHDEIAREFNIKEVAS